MSKGAGNLVAWLSVEAETIGGPDLWGTLRRSDLMPELDAVVRHGWRIVDGAVLLSSWHDSYHGSRSVFPETMDYEIAVNGRGIPDLDLSEDMRVRLPLLLRRGAAFAWSALRAQLKQFPDIEVAAYVTISPTLFDPDYFTGNTTFCTVRPGERPYITQQLLDNDEIVAAAFTNDCVPDLT
jgi:hypothetical protein